MRQVTLNDNQRVDAEKRIKILTKRRSMVIAISSHVIGDGMMYLNKDIGRGRKLTSKINIELGKLYKFLKIK